MQSLREAVHAWVESCLERKVLREALEEAGFRLNNSGDVPNEVSIIQISPNMQSEPIHQELEISVPAYIAAGLYPTHAPC